MRQPENSFCLTENEQDLGEKCIVTMDSMWRAAHTDPEEEEHSKLPRGSPGSSVKSNSFPALPTPSSHMNHVLQNFEVAAILGVFVSPETRVLSKTEEHDNMEMT